MRDRSDALVIYACGAAAVVAAVLFKEFFASGKKIVIDFCAGGVAGAIAKTLSAPIENCKNALRTTWYSCRFTTCVATACCEDDLELRS